MDKSTEKTADESTMLTVHEVAQYLRISEAKVYRLVKEGRIPVIHIGRAWRFRKDLLDKWLVQCAELSLKGDDQSAVHRMPERLNRLLELHPASVHPFAAALLCDSPP